ncbi:MAG: hypothetical protein ACJ8CR_19985 [Roseiflexaceae bacterium]
MTQEPLAQPTIRALRPATLTLDHVWLAAALILIALRPLLSPIPPHDFWWHLATGRAIVAQGRIPTTDSFSYTQFGQPFYNQGWLAELLMYGIYQLGGVPLILLVQSLVMALAYGLLLRLCVIRTGRLRLCVVLLLLATLPLSFSNWVVRPQSYTFPIFVGFLTILTEYRLGRSNRLWLLPLLMALWVNMHGAFVLGLALIGLTFIGEFLKRFKPNRRPTTDDRRPTTDDGPISQFSILNSQFILWSALTALAVLLNPRGTGVLSYVRNLLGSSSVTTLVEEWAPPTIRDAGSNGLIFFLFVIGCAAVLIYARRRPELTDMLLFGAFFWLALGATRNIVWFGFVATPLLVTQAATLLPAPGPARRPAGSPVLNAVLIGLLALLLVLGLPWVKPSLDLPPEVGALLTEDTPVAAVERLRTEPERPRHLFHSEGYGSYLIWAAPEQPVFIDTRIELYPYQQWADYINLGQGNNVAELLQKYAIDGLLLNKQRQERLVAVMRADPAWMLRYEDAQTIYLLRRQ